MRSLIIVVAFSACGDRNGVQSVPLDGGIADGDLFDTRIPCENDIAEDGTLLPYSADCPVEFPYCVLDWCTDCQLVIHPYQPDPSGIIVESEGCTDDEICDYTILACRPRLASECGELSQCGRDEVCTCGESIPLLTYRGCQCIPAGECLIDADCCYAEGYACFEGACQDGICSRLCTRANPETGYAAPGDCPSDQPYCVLDQCSECIIAVHSVQPDTDGVLVESLGCTGDEICDYSNHAVCRTRSMGECERQAECGKGEVCSCGPTIYFSYNGCQCIPAGTCLASVDCCFVEGYRCDPEDETLCQEGMCQVAE